MAATAQKNSDCCLIVRCNPQSHCQTLRWCSGPWVPSSAAQCPGSCGVCRQFLVDQGLDAIACPSCSPDLLMYQCIRCCQVPLQTVQELTATRIQVWEEIPKDTICWLIRSMPRRCSGVHTGTQGQYTLLSHIMSSLWWNLCFYFLCGFESTMIWFPLTVDTSFVINKLYNGHQ